MSPVCEHDSAKISSLPSRLDNLNKINSDLFTLLGRKYF